MQLEQLKNIGLTEGELKVYEALLELGESTKTMLVKTAGIAPANLYDIANRLAEKGIIAITQKDGIQHFSATHPRQLKEFLAEKKRNICAEEAIVERILPQLTAKYAAQNKKATVEVLTGWKGLKTIFTDLLEECNSGDHNYVFGAAKGSDEKKADAFFLRYSRIRASKGIILNILFNEELRERQERIPFFLQNKNINARFLKQTTNTEFMLYKGTVVIILLGKEPFAIRIRDPQSYDSFKQQFDLLWQIAKD